MKAKVELTTEIKAGMNILFTPTGKTFILAKVTDKNVSWYNDFEYQANKNTMKMTCINRQSFQRGINSGSYIIQ